MTTHYIVFDNEWISSESESEYDDESDDNNTEYIEALERLRMYQEDLVERRHQFVYKVRTELAYTIEKKERRRRWISRALIGMEQYMNGNKDSLDAYKFRWVIADAIKTMRHLYINRRALYAPKFIQTNPLPYRRRTVRLKDIRIKIPVVTIMEPIFEDTMVEL